MSTTSRPRRGLRRTAAVGAASLTLLGAALLTGTPARGTDPAGDAPTTSPLDAALQAVEEAGVYGVYAAARDGEDRWRGAAGVADVRTGRPVTPDMRHRVGSVTKTFTAVAVLQLVGEGRVELDAPAAEYLPDLVPHGLDPAVTVRMLLNHTSGIGDHVLPAFPSLRWDSPASIDHNRFRDIDPRRLARLGLAEPRTGAPGETWSYSNTNYVLAGLLLEEVTGEDAEAYITEHVIGPAGLRDTYFPRSPRLQGPHPRMYESLFGLIDPPRDYSVYDMSWAWVAGSLVSTMDDLNRFYAALFDGRLLGPDELAEMRRTVPTSDEPGAPGYGLALMTLDLSCGTVWGHDGSVWGAGTIVLSSADGERQASVGLNRQKYQTVSEDGELQPHPADAALGTYLDRALCGGDAARPAAAPAVPWLSSPGR